MFLLCFKLKNTLPSNLKSMLYRALVVPHLEYCAVAWMECSKVDCIKLEKIQNRGMSLILSAKLDYSSTKLRSRLQWSTLEDRRRMQRAICTKKYLCGECPAYSRRIFHTKCAALEEHRTSTYQHPKPNGWPTPSYSRRVRNGIIFRKQSEHYLSSNSKTLLSTIIMICPYRSPVCVKH